MVTSCNLHIPQGQQLGDNVTQNMGPKQKVLVIFNGLWQSIEAFQITQDSLKSAFLKQNWHIIIATIAENVTDDKSIEQQAADAFITLKNSYAASQYELILLGHSQGGLRAAQILTLNKQTGNPLDIKGLVTTATPWEGAPAATITKQTVNNYFSTLPANFFLTSAKYIYPASVHLSNTIEVNRFFDQNFPTHKPGITDLVPGSSFLVKIANNLMDSRLPILAIAGSNGDLKTLLLRSGLHTQYNIHPYFLHALPLNSTYRHIFAGGLRQEHDMVVPLSSQLASNIRKDNNFKTHIIRDAVHDFLPGLNLVPDQVIYTHPVCIEKTINFLKEHFQL